MTSQQRARLGAIEHMISDHRRAAEIAAKPSCEMTDAECVIECHRLAHAHPPGMYLQSSADDAEIVAEAWRLVARSYGR